MTQGDERRVDVVILTAIQLEYDEVSKVDARAVDGARWEQPQSEGGLPVAFRRSTGKGDRPRRVAVAVAPDMGTTAGIATLSPLVERLEPRCIAMCGLCARRADKGVLLGDVIAADRVYYHDTGKQRADGVEQDLSVYKLRDDWKLALGRMDPVALFGGESRFQDRPLTTEWREQRALVALRDRVAEPWTVVDPAMREPSWQRIVASPRERQLLAASGRDLTEDGRRLGSTTANSRKVKAQRHPRTQRVRSPVALRDAEFDVEDPASRRADQPSTQWLQARAAIRAPRTTPRKPRARDRIGRVIGWTNPRPYERRTIGYVGVAQSTHGFQSAVDVVYTSMAAWCIFRGSKALCYRSPPATARMDNGYRALCVVSTSS